MANLPALSRTLTPSLPEHLAADDARDNHREWIGGAVKTLLLMFDSFPSDPRVQAEQGRMWADALEWFPKGVIEAAISAYLRTETRKPVPAAIIKLCREHMPRPEPVAQLEAPERRTTPEERERIAKMVAANFPELRRMPRSGDE